MADLEALPARLRDLLVRTDFAGARHRWAQCSPTAEVAESREVAAWWLAAFIVRLRCGGSMHLYENWRRQVAGDLVLPDLERKILEIQLKENLGTPAAPGSDDHLEGLVAEHIWYALQLEYETHHGAVVRIEEPSWSVTDKGADGIVVYRGDTGLTFRLWESKKHAAMAPVRDTVNGACRQLEDEGAMRYLARASKIAQEVETEDAELASLYGRMSEHWARGDERAGMGITVTVSDDADVDECFSGLPNYFEQLKGDHQREGFLAQIPDYPGFAKRVREVVWSGL